MRYPTNFLLTQNTISSIIEAWPCRVSIVLKTHKTFNINSLSNPVVEGVSKCDFAMSRDVACRVSISTIVYKTFNINSLSNQIVESVSKLLFQCGSRDAINRVSTTALGKSLIFNILYVATLVETWRAASLQHQCRNFDTPTTTGLSKLPDTECLISYCRYRDAARHVSTLAEIAF